MLASTKENISFRTLNSLQDLVKLKKKINLTLQLAIGLYTLHKGPRELVPFGYRFLQYFRILPYSIYTIVVRLGQWAFSGQLMLNICTLKSLHHYNTEHMSQTLSWVNCWAQRLHLWLDSKGSGWEGLKNYRNLEIHDLLPWKLEMRTLRLNLTMKK